MWVIDANVFVMRLMRQVLERRCIRWTYADRIHFWPLPYREEDGYIESKILQITLALEKLSLIENLWDLEDFEHLSPNLGSSDQDFLDLFVECISSCYLKDYSPFNFLRYMRYTIDFGIFCFRRGFYNALNCAVISIAWVMIAVLDDVFLNMESWKKMVNESARIIRQDFQHPYIYNHYLHRHNVSQQPFFQANLDRQ